MSFVGYWISFWLQLAALLFLILPLMIGLENKICEHLYEFNRLMLFFEAFSRHQGAKKTKEKRL
jgi:hypothetical protein